MTPLDISLSDNKLSLIRGWKVASTRGKNSKKRSVSLTQVLKLHEKWRSVKGLLDFIIPILVGYLESLNTL